MLEEWLRSYKPDELFDETGKLRAELANVGARRRASHGRQSACEWWFVAQGLKCPTIGEYAVAVPTPGTVEAEATRVVGRFPA